MPRELLLQLLRTHSPIHLSSIFERIPSFPPTISFRPGYTVCLEARNVSTLRQSLLAPIIARIRTVLHNQLDSIV